MEFNGRSTGIGTTLPGTKITANVGYYYNCTEYLVPGTPRMYDVLVLLLLYA